MISTLLFAVHLAVALLIIDRGLKVMGDADLFNKQQTWTNRRDTAAVCVAWLALSTGAFISLIAYVFTLGGTEVVSHLANPLLLIGASMLLVTEKYRTGKT